MSAAVCGTKRAFFEDLPSPPVSKRIRSSSSSSSPIRSSPTGSPLDQIRSVFPHIEIQFLERTLKECGEDLDAAIKSLRGISTVSITEQSDSAEQVQGLKCNDNGAAGENPPAPDNLPCSGAEWVELLVSEMTKSVGINDAKARASGVLEILEKSISARAGEEAAQSFQQESTTMKRQIETLMKENSVLKRAVSIQHERQKDYEAMNQEIQNLKQVVSQYHDKLRTLEINNYALRLHLRQAQQGNSALGRFNPDVF